MKIRYFNENKKYFKWYLNNKPKYNIINVSVTKLGKIKVEYTPLAQN